MTSPAQTSSQPLYGVHAIRDVMMPMRDGIRLATDIFLPCHGDGRVVDASEKVPALLVRTSYDKTAPEYYESIGHPILITLSGETPPHQFEACTILSRSLRDVRVERVPGGHMGVITESGAVMPLLAGWLIR